MKSIRKAVDAAVCTIASQAVRIHVRTRLRVQPVQTRPWRDLYDAKRRLEDFSVKFIEGKPFVEVARAAELGKADENPFLLDQYTADYVFNPVDKMSSFQLSQPLEIGEGGTGFMCIPRETFET